jgi:quercetin dioxygenase-like cupin family protein
MEIKSMQPRDLQIKDDSSNNCRLLAFDLPSLISTMRQNYTWAKGELNSLILLKSPQKHIILAAIHDGNEIESFQSNDSISFQVIEGKLRFHSRKDTVTLVKGQVMTLNEHIKYHLTTREETIFLLTISNNITKIN